MVYYSKYLNVASIGKRNWKVNGSLGRGKIPDLSLQEPEYFALVRCLLVASTFCTGLKVEGLMKEFLECCSIFVNTVDNRSGIDCYKSNRFFKKFTGKNQEIKKEILLVSYCMNCGHYILKFLWYTNKNSTFFDYAESKLIKGKEADKIFAERANDLSLYPLPKNKQKKPSFLKQSKKIPWTYYKSLDGQSQIRRYIDESGNAGKKIRTPVNILKAGANFV